MSSEVDPINLGNPKEFTVIELAHMVLRAVGGPSTIEFSPLPTDDPRIRQPDIGRAMARLGWQPVVDISEGLALTIDYFRKQLERVH
jgi:UDP-glucuronate decarboxylase